MNNLEQVVSLYRSLETRKASIDGAAAFFESQVSTLKDQLNVLLGHKTKLESIKLFFQQTSEKVQLLFVKKIEDLVSQGLSFVFEDKMIFSLVPKQTKSGGFDLQVNGYDIDKWGGGVIALADFLFRVLFILNAPNVRRMLILDEPFSHLSRNYQYNAGVLVKTLSDQLGVQMVVVTHSEEFAEAADVKVRLIKSGAYSKVEVI